MKRLSIIAAFLLLTCCENVYRDRIVEEGVITGITSVTNYTIIVKGKSATYKIITTNPRWKEKDLVMITDGSGSDWNIIPFTEGNDGHSKP